MLIDTITNANYAGRYDAVRKIGLKEFQRKVKRNELVYKECSYEQKNMCRIWYGGTSHYSIRIIINQLFLYTFVM